MQNFASIGNGDPAYAFGQILCWAIILGTGALVIRHYVNKNR